MQQRLDSSGFYALAQNRLLAFVALLPAGCEAINAAPWPGAERTGATIAPVIGLQKLLGPCLFTDAEHGGAALFRAADGAVIAQKQIAIAAIDATLLPGTRGVGGQCRSTEQRQKYPGHRHPATANQLAHGISPSKMWPDDINVSGNKSVTTTGHLRLYQLQHES